MSADIKHKDQVAERLENGAPKLIDPGRRGWAQEPKVTTAELLLYGDHAGIVRLLGQAAVDAGDAYSLACKAAQETEGEAGPESIGLTWQLYLTARRTHREIAESAIAAHRAVVDPS